MVFAFTPVTPTHMNDFQTTTIKSINPFRNKDINMNKAIYNTIDIAAAYIRKGYAAIPVQSQSKRPITSGWQNLKLNEDNFKEYFTSPYMNVGVVLGDASNGLIDVDLDDPVALLYADHFLPKTDSIFGRDESA